ncbi:MAG: hypothetical protein KKB25_03485, partial [Nanoarchaeota archaeon]|nr:hypothetical protein [Nanoarchaeota archaeon]
LRTSNLDYVSSPLLREMANAKLIEHGFEEARSDYTRIGMPVFDITELINIGSNENANLQYNPETLHKLIADNVFKEYALMKAIPKHATDAHLHGLVHIHDLDYFVLRPFCLDSEEKILVDDGATRIVKIGEFADSIIGRSGFQTGGNEVSFVSGINVYAFNPKNYAVGKVPLTAVSRRKFKGKMLEIKTKFTKRTLKLTPEHILFVWENGIKEIKAGEIRKGDKILLPKKINIEKPVTEINLIEEFIKCLPSEELKNIYVHNLHSYKKFLRNLCRETQEKIFSRLSLAQITYRNPISLYNFKIIAEKYGVPYRLLKEMRLLVPGSQNYIPAVLKIDDKLTRLLGYFVSEGNYNVSEDNSYNLVLTAFDREMQNDMKACIEKFSTYCTFNKKRKQFYFGGKLLYLIFKRVFKVNEGARNKNIPRFLFDSSEETICHFLKAYLSGDGGINKSAKSLFRIEANTTSKTLAEELAYLFARIGIVPSLRIYPNICNIGFGGKEQIKEFAEKIGFIQTKKAKAVENYLRNVKDKGSGNKIEKHKIEDLFFEEVWSVSETIPSSEYVYDLSVDSHHNFISGTFGPVLVHNCFSHDLRFFFKKGYYADGQGIHTASAGPAKHAEVAVLHAAKILASAQTNCFHKDEPVMIEEDGMIKTEKISEIVEKLKTGKEINSFGVSDYKIIRQPILQFNEHDADEEMLEVSLENGKAIRLLASHPMFVFDETRFKEVLAKGLKIGDYVPVPIKLPSSKNNMEELDLVEEVGQQKNLHVHEDAFNFERSKFSLPKKIKITEKFMRLLGYYVSEGSVVCNEESSVYDVQFSFGSHEKELIEDAKDCIKTVFGFDAEESNPYSWVTELKFGGKLAAILFEKLCGRYAKNKKVPWLMFNVNENMRIEFLKAYFDGDGHSHKNEIVFDTVSKRLASDLSYLLLQLGLLSRIRKETCGERKIGGRTLKETLRYRVEVQIKNFEKIDKYIDGFVRQPVALQIPTNHAGLRELYSEIKPSFDANLRAALQKERTSRKKAGQMLAEMKKYCRTGEQKKRIEELEKICAGDIGFLKIKEIRKEKVEGKFYDLTTPSRTFVGSFGGVLVHNCGGGQGFNWFNIFLAPYMRGFDYKKMKQMAQMFLFEMSQMYVARG